jgi:Family of unknown function (DUF5908)
MPLEIREVIIKATLGEGGSNHNSFGNVAVNQGDSNEILINRCVEKVLEILKEKSER